MFVIMRAHLLFKKQINNSSQDRKTTFSSYYISKENVYNKKCFKSRGLTE